MNLEPRNLLVHARFCLQNVYELVKALNCNIEILIIQKATSNADKML